MQYTSLVLKRYREYITLCNVHKKLWAPVSKRTTGVPDVRLDEVKDYGRQIVPEDRPDTTPLAGFQRPQIDPTKVFTKSTASTEI